MVKLGSFLVQMEVQSAKTEDYLGVLVVQLAKKVGFLDELASLAAKSKDQCHHRYKMDSFSQAYRSKMDFSFATRPRGAYLVR